MKRLLIVLVVLLSHPAGASKDSPQDLEKLKNFSNDLTHVEVEKKEVKPDLSKEPKEEPSDESKIFIRLRLK